MVVINTCQLEPRKLAFCICENIGTDQLRGNCATGQRLFFRYIDTHVVRRTCGRTWRCRYGVNSYSSQFVLKSIRTHFGQFVLSFRSIRTHLLKFSQLVLILVNSYSVWSIRTHTKKYNFDDIYHITYDR